MELQGLQDGLMPPTPAATQKKLMGLGGLEVKVGEIAPSLGDRELHVPAWFWHRFGTILVPQNRDYDRISMFFLICI